MDPVIEVEAESCPDPTAQDVETSDPQTTTAETVPSTSTDPSLAQPSESDPSTGQGQSDTAAPDTSVEPETPAPIDTRYAKFTRRVSELSEANLSSQCRNMVQAGVFLKVTTWATSRKNMVYKKALAQCKEESFQNEIWDVLKFQEGQASASDKRQVQILMSMALLEVMTTEYLDCR